MAEKTKMADTWQKGVSKGPANRAMTTYQIQRVGRDVVGQCISCQVAHKRFASVLRVMLVGLDHVHSTLGEVARIDKHVWIVC